MKRRCLKIALVFSKSTNMFWIEHKSDRKYAEWIGWKHAIEAYGYPYDIITDSDLEDASKLSSCCVIVLPEVSAMSDSAAENIIDFVRRGGILVISSKWGPFWHPDGTERKNHEGQPEYPRNFTDMMGIDSSPTQNIKNGAVFSYVDTSHAFYKDISPSEAKIMLSARCVGSGFNVFADTKVVSKVRGNEIEVPAIITHDYGNGMCIYFNFQIGGIVADYENDVCNENSVNGFSRELPRKDAWTQGECHILKVIMKNTMDFALKKKYGCVVRVWQGINAAKSVVILSHDVDSNFGWRSGISFLRAEEEKRRLVSTWYVQPDSTEYSLDSGKLFELVSRGHEIGLHGTDSYASHHEMQREMSVIQSFLTQNCEIESERQHCLHRIRLNSLDEETTPTHVYESQSGFVCSSTLPVYSRWEPHKVSSGVKCYLPYHGVYWDVEAQEFIETDILTIPIVVQDVWMEETVLESLGAFLKFRFMAKLTETIFGHYYDKKILTKWKEIFDYCHRKNVTFCLSTHPDSKYEEGTGSPDRARKIYGSFLDHVLNKDRVFIYPAAKYAKWWKAREQVIKNLNVIVDSSHNRIVARVSKTEESGITLIFELLNKDSISSLKINGITCRSFLVDRNTILIILPQSNDTLSVEVIHNYENAKK